MHPCSGGRFDLVSGALLRLPTLTRSRGRTPRLGVRHLCGGMGIARGEAFARRGRSFALCVPVLPVCLNAYALTIFSRVCPRPDGLPSGCADALSIACRGTGCTTGDMGPGFPPYPSPKPLGAAILATLAPGLFSESDGATVAPWNFAALAGWAASSWMAKALWRCWRYFLAVGLVSRMWCAGAAAPLLRSACQGSGRIKPEDGIRAEGVQAGTRG